MALYLFLINSNDAHQDSSTEFPMLETYSMRDSSASSDIPC